MRLIDADAFLERFEAMCETETDSVIAMVLRGALVDEPTAYDVDSVVQQIKTLSPANYVSKDDVLKIVKGDNFSPKSEKNSFFNFDEVLRIECEKARSKAIDDFVAEFKNKDSELRKSCDNWFYYSDAIGKRERLFIDYYHPANRYPALLNYYGIVNIYQQALISRNNI